VRAPTRQELKATSILAMRIEEASAKVRSGPPDDDDTPDALHLGGCDACQLVVRRTRRLPRMGIRDRAPTQRAATARLGQGLAVSEWLLLDRLRRPAANAHLAVAR
jgi:hypothetical protein